MSRRPRREPNLAEPGLAEALAAYEALMDTVVPESQYWQGKRPDVDKELYLGGIVERAAARAREQAGG